MFTIVKQKTKWDDIQIEKLETLTATRFEATEAQKQKYYFFEVTHIYKDMQGKEKKEIVFTYTDNLIWECSESFEMIATIANRFDDSDQTIKEKEIREKQKALNQKCKDAIDTLMILHKKGTIKTLPNLQAGLNELNNLSLEKWFNPFCKDLVSLLQYEYCEIFKGDKDFYDCVCTDAKTLFYR